MSTEAFDPSVLSVTAASARGVAGLVKDAEGGTDVVVARHGKPVAALVSMRRLREIETLEDDLRDVALVLTRALTDTGERHELDDVLSAFGHDRATLEAELADDLAHGRG